MAPVKPAGLKFLCCSLFLLPSLWAGAQGQGVGESARTRALGGTGITLTTAEAAFTNPAGLALTPAPGAVVSAEQRFGLSDLTFLNAAVAHPLGGSGGVALSLSAFSLDVYAEQRFGLAYGYRLNDRLQIGVELTTFSSQAEAYESYFDLTGGLGVRYLVSEEITLGARLFSPVRVTQGEGEDFLPQLLALGGSYRFSDQLSLNAEVHQDVEYPARFRFGLEYLPVESLAIRLGLATAAAELSFGLGYTVLDNVRLAFSGSYHEQLGWSPTFGVRYGAD